MDELRSCAPKQGSPARRETSPLLTERLCTRLEELRDPTSSPTAPDGWAAKESDATDALCGAATPTIRQIGGHLRTSGSS